MATSAPTSMYCGGRKRTRICTKKKVWRNATEASPQLPLGRTAGCSRDICSRWGRRCLPASLRRAALPASSASPPRLGNRRASDSVWRGERCGRRRSASPTIAPRRTSSTIYQGGGRRLAKRRISNGRIYSRGRMGGHVRCPVGFARLFLKALRLGLDRRFRV